MFKANLLKVAFVFISSMLLMACANHQMSSQKLVQESTQEVRCKVNLQIERNAIPKTPNNMSLPKFGQNVIGWATGPEGAKNRLENIQKQDLKAIQEKGTTLAMVKEWQAFYENEVQRNSCNPTAPYRAELMKRITELWVD